MAEFNLEDMPNEMLVEFITRCGDERTYRNFIMAVPQVGRLAADPWCNKKMRKHFLKQDGHGNWGLCGMMHREDGPAVDDKLYKAWYQYGKLHRDFSEGPAEIRYHENGDLRSETWIENNKFRVSITEPCEVNYDDNNRFEDYRVPEDDPKGRRLIMKDYHDNMMCKEIHYYHGSDKTIQRRDSYIYSQGKLHEKNRYRGQDLYSRIYYNIYEVKYRKCWFENGVVHRDKGPAIIEYYKNGNIKEERWYQEGELSRNEYDSSNSGQSCPAVVKYDINGNVISD